MSEARLERMESHMEQLIVMVAENNKLSQNILERMDRLELKVDKREQRLDRLEETSRQELRINETRHKELFKEFRNSNVEIDYLRNQVSKHDMEIHKLKASN